MRRFVSAGILLAGLILAAGCNPFSQAKLAYQTVRGPQAHVTPVEIAAPARLAPYRGIELGKVTTDLPAICTPEVLAKVNQSTITRLGEAEMMELFPGKPPRMSFDVITRFYKGKGVIGGEGRLDWLVKLYDVESGDLLGTIFVEGVSASPVQFGISDMARENTEELLEFLKERQEQVVPTSE